MRSQHEIADVFKLYGDQYRATHAINPDQRKVMAAITACRTNILGGHEHCDNCGIKKNSYKCRNRHCPKCQTMAKEEWLDKRRSELLPCGYFHIVFTSPHALNPLILENRKELLGCLFAAVKETLFAFSADPNWRLEGKPGLLTILHTWSQTLIDHFHIHCLIPAGVLSFDGRKWIKSNDKFIFGAKSLAMDFKKRYLTMIESRQEELVLPEGTSLQIRKAWSKDWVVYAKRPFADPEQVLEYLGRYTHRIAISNHRIKSIDNGKVVFTYKNRADNNSTKHMSMDAMEFIRRFLLHVLPKRFMKIRYYGFLANICKRKAVLLIRRLIGVDMATRAYVKETIREKMLRLTGTDILLCQHCKKGHMIQGRRLIAFNSS